MPLSTRHLVAIASCLPWLLWGCVRGPERTPLPRTSDARAEPSQPSQPSSNDPASPSPVEPASPDLLGHIEPPTDRHAITFPQAAKGPGAVVASPRIVYVTFGDDPLERQITRFHERLRDGTTFNSASREYGVGPIASVQHVRISEPAPETIDDPGIHAWLAERLAEPDAPTGKAARGALGSPDVSTLYALYFPATTTILYNGRPSCSWNGYHGDTRVEDTPIAYAIMPRCAADEPGTTDLDRLTMVASHEYFEWVTDPFPRQIRAWHFVENDAAAWALAFAAELSDLCYGYRLVPEDLGFSVQPVWSNRAARAGEDPCQPAPEAPFAFPVPRLRDRFELPLVNTQEVLSPTDEVPGVVVPPGAETRIFIDLHSNAPQDTPFRLTAQDGGRMVGPKGLTLDLATDVIHPGELVELRIMAPASFDETAVVLLRATDPDSGRMGRWPFLVSPRR